MWNRAFNLKWVFYILIHTGGVPKVMLPLVLIFIDTFIKQKINFILYIYSIVYYIYKYIVDLLFFNTTAFIFYTLMPAWNKFFKAVNEKLFRFLTRPFSHFSFHFVVTLTNEFLWGETSLVYVCSHKSCVICYRFQFETYFYEPKIQ